MSEARIQFILKRREDYNQQLHGKSRTLSTGLFNSVNFIHEMLLANDYNSDMVVVTDNNDIDREVTRYRPTHCIIEALWVVPSKFNVLCQLHPDVTWIVRLHSEMPFMANEGIAMDWIADYARYPNVLVACNAPRMRDEARKYLRVALGLTHKKSVDKVIYLPNYYSQEYSSFQVKPKSREINISCFGAVRPLKNHLLQALAAIDYASETKKKLNFHINGNRTEMKGEPVLNNLKGMFQNVYDAGHRLIMHDWMPHDDFLNLCSTMDLGMQVSFTETFNIVAADHVSMGVPLVGSREIPWSSELFRAEPTELASIKRKIYQTMAWPRVNVWANQRKLYLYTEESKWIWLEYFD
jgi:hypothetical protein